VHSYTRSLESGDSIRAGEGCLIHPPRSFRSLPTLKCGAHLYGMRH
jgi:hypothetical protein